MEETKLTNYKLCTNLCCHVCGQYGNTLKRCTRCRKVLYCSRNCQIKDWSSHKLLCNKEANINSSTPPVAQDSSTNCERGSQHEDTIVHVHEHHVCNKDVTKIQSIPPVAQETSTSFERDSHHEDDRLRVHHVCNKDTKKIQSTPPVAQENSTNCERDLHHEDGRLHVHHVSNKNTKKIQSIPSPAQDHEERSTNCERDLHYEDRLHVPHVCNKDTKKIQSIPPVAQERSTNCERDLHHEDGRLPCVCNKLDTKKIQSIPPAAQESNATCERDSHHVNADQKMCTVSNHTLQLKSDTNITVKCMKVKHNLIIDSDMKGNAILQYIATSVHIPVKILKLVCKGKIMTAETIDLFVKNKAIFQAIGEVAESEGDLESGHIDCIMTRLGVDRNNAIRALRDAQGDVVDAILYLGNK